MWPRLLAATRPQWPSIAYPREMDLHLGTGFSVAKRLWEAFHDRPATMPLFRLADYGPPVRGVVTSAVGKQVEIEIHSVGRQPALVRGLSINLSDGRSIPLEQVTPALGQPMPRPSFVEARIELADLATRMRDTRLREVVVDMSPVRVQRHAFPPAWRGLPDKEPPSEKGSGRGASFVAIY